MQRKNLSMKKASAKSALKVQEALGPDYEVLEFEETTRTAADAAAAIGCTVPQIAKSMIFKAKDSGRCVLVVTSGSVRVSESKVTELLGENIGRADPEFVRENTGFAIGGVPPVGHISDPVVFIDETLLSFETLWAAAGTPNAVFPLTPDQLMALTAGTVADIGE